MASMAILGIEKPSSPSAPSESPLAYILIESTMSSWKCPVLSIAARVGRASISHSAAGAS